MRNMCLGITAFVVTVGMGSVGAQGRNFSGTWIIDSEKTQAAALASTDQSSRAIVARGEGTGGGGTGGAVVAAGAGGGGGRARGTGSAEASAGAGGGGAAVSERRIAAGGAMVAAGGGGGGAVRGGVGVPVDTIITLDANNFTIDQGGVQTSYPTNGTETTVTLRGTTTAKARASWKGDMLVIEQTIDTANGPVTSATSWFMEGDSLVRLTTRRTYFKKK